MKFKELGRDNGKTKIELEGGELLEVTDAEKEAIKADKVEIVPHAPVGSLQNQTLATHKVVLKVDEPAEEATEEVQSPTPPVTL